MSVWEVRDPKGPYTFETDTHEVASLLLIVLSAGKIGAKEIGGKEREIPMLQFSVEWYEKRFGRSIDTGKVELAGKLRAALDSVLVGNSADRARMEAVVSVIQDPEDQVAARKAWQNVAAGDKDVVGRAQEVLKSLRGAA